MDNAEVDRVREWMEQAVLRLGLCPFAAEPWNTGRVRMAVTHATTETRLLEDLHAELKTLCDSASETIETTLLIVPDMLEEFADYNQFLDLAEALIEQQGWTDKFQLASFHPHYQFAGTEPNDPSNLTNCSPYPILHLLRESSVTRAVESYPNVDQIPIANIETLRGLNEQRRREIFGK